MFRSVKSQIVFATSLIIILMLGATAYFVIDTKIKEVNNDIFVRATSFAELTHERVITNYENNYLHDAFAHFDRELAEIYSLNTDIIGLAILDYAGENLYVAPSIKELSGTPPDEEEMERIQAIYPSVKTKKSGRVIYIEKKDSETRYTNFNGADIDSIGNTEQIKDMFQPFRDPNNSLRLFSIHYYVSYDSLTARIQKTATDILVVALFGIIISLFVGGVVAERITSPIKKLTAGAHKIGAGDLKTRIPVTSKSEIGMLARTFNHMAEHLEESTEAMVEKEKMSRELELAGEIQRELLPKELPKIKNLDIAVSLSSAEEVGGDCYDFIKIDDDKLLFYIADVTGHGVPAGLVSAISNALVPAFLDKYNKTDDLIINLNRIIKMKTRPNVFMTMVMAVWSAEKKDLRFAQAGHDPILYYRAANKSVTELASGGMALGMIPDISKIAKSETVQSEVDDVFVLYTDGIPEAWASEDDIYGMDRFKESIAKHSTLTTAQEIHDAIISDVRAFMGDYPQADDITIIVIKRTV